MDKLICSEPKRRAIRHYQMKYLISETWKLRGLMWRMK